MNNTNTEQSVDPTDEPRGDRLYMALASDHVPEPAARLYAYGAAAFNDVADRDVLYFSLLGAKLPELIARRVAFGED